MAHVLYLTELALPKPGLCTAGSITGLTLAATGGNSSAIGNGDTLPLEAGDNITTTAGATDKVTIANRKQPNVQRSSLQQMVQVPDWL